MKKLLVISSIIIISGLFSYTFPDEWKTYNSAIFSVSCPEDFIIDTSNVYTHFIEGKGIKGVSFTVPKSFKDSTNLTEAYISVEWIPVSRDCSAKKFVSNSVKDTIIIENGVHYSVAFNGEGAAGSIYEETAYSLLTEKYCIGIRLFIHSSNMGNYDPGTIKEFDKAAIEQIYRKMRDTFKIAVN